MLMPDPVTPDQWYIKTKNGKRGPYSVQQLQRYVDAGAIVPNSGVGNGQGPWVAAATVPGLNFSADSVTQVCAANQATPSSITTGNAAAATLKQRAAELQAREQALQDRSEKLDARGNELDARGDELDALAIELERRGRELDQRAEDIDQRAEDIDQRESQCDQQQQEVLSRSEALQQRETELQRQQEQLDARAEELDALAAELEQQRERQAARIAETQQLETQREAEQAALQRRREELDEREQALADREQAARQLEQSLQEEQQQLADAAPDASATPPPVVTSDEVPDVSAESILEEKKRLLQEFADRQESLSRREAELIRRENELTRRELDIVVTPDASTEPGWELEPESEATPEPVEAATPVHDPTPEPPAESVAEESGSTDSPPASWQDVLGRVQEQPADFELAEYDEVSAAAVATAGDVGVAPTRATEARATEDQQAVVAAAQTGLSELRRLAYEERFGPRSRYDVDDDPAMRVDVSVHLPEAARDFTTLVTSGMSDYPIPMPNGQRSVRAELLLYVTHLDELAIQVLRGAAKLPFRKKKGLSIGTTESLDGLHDPLSGSQQQDCVYMLPVVESDSKPIQAKEVIGGVVQLFWLVTITEAERKLIDTGGIHKFLSLLEKNNHAVFFDLMRDCYVKRKGWFRR
ncbi:Suppressor of fused protein (SUFU) [Stieleria neptunia]|uniref:Suppressor of fused protein (SUFU) n=1 Tax=Stieleria neptunia TaxID=2527979 RepID=A0A518I1J1_9BACT|nr:suppressor of fused domain protein [Stieleria neptunia]QDV46926.1 Suppressor of fused protein (SUFU) [Stieleria neptunia]